MGHLQQLFVVVMCHGAYEMDWQVRTLVGRDVATEEKGEIVENQLFYQRIVQMLTYI